MQLFHTGVENDERPVTSLLSGPHFAPRSSRRPGNDKRVTTSSVYVLVASLLYDVH